MSDELILKRDLIRVPKKFIDYRVSQGLAVPKIVWESKENNRGFGSYYFRRDDPALVACVQDAEQWVDPGGPFRMGAIVKAARYFLKAVKSDAAAQLRANIRGV